MTAEEMMADDTPVLGQRAKRRRARPPSQKSKESEQRIYAAAAQVFDRQGYPAASLQDIADAAGMVKGSLYYYIDGKEDLLLGIARRIHENAMQNLELSRESVGDGRARLSEFVRGHVLGNPDMPRAEALVWIRVFYREFRYLDKSRLTGIMEQRHAYEQHLAELITICREEGWACPELDVGLAGQAILSMVNSVSTWYSARHATLDDIADLMAHLVLQSLTCPPEHDHAAPKKRTAKKRPTS